MPSPVPVQVTEGGLTAAAANLPVTLPPGGASTDEYIVIIAKGSVSCTINALAGWTELLDEAVALGLAIIRYTGAGVPSNPTFVQSAASRSVWCAFRITGANKSIAPEIGTTATGTSTTPNPPSRAVTGGPKDVLSIVCFAAAGELADDDSLVTTFPTNYNEIFVEKTGGTGGTNLGGILGAGARRLTAVSTEDPGTFTQNASRAWRAQTIIVHPVPPKQTSVGRISLAPASEPETRTAHQLKVTAKITGGAGTIRMALYEGATNRSGDLESALLSGTDTEYTLPISNGNAAAIVDYSDLEIRFWGYSVAGDAATFSIEKMWLELPPAGVPVPGSYSLDGTDDKIVYADAPALDALNLSDYLVLAWIRPGAGGNNNGRIFSRAAAASGGPVGHMQLMVGNGLNGTRDTNFSARQKHGDADTHAVAVSATGVVPNDAWSCVGMHYQGSVPRIFDAGTLLTPASTTTPTGVQDTESDQGVTIGNSAFGDRQFQGQIAYIGIWNVSSLSDADVNTLVSNFYNGGTGTPAVPRQDLLVEFIRLDANGSVDGEKSVLVSPTVTGAVFSSSNVPPVTYQELSLITPDTDNFFPFI